MSLPAQLLVNMLNPQAAGEGKPPMLHQLQQDFLMALISEENPSPSAINNTNERLAIYRRSSEGARLRALKDAYPVTEKLLGSAFFNRMAEMYCAKTQSYSPDLADYGENFSNFAAEFPPLASLNYLPDVIQLEWAWHRAFYGPEQIALDKNDLVDAVKKLGGQLTFQLPCNARLISSSFPILKIWQANQENVLETPTIDLQEGCVHLLIWRSVTEIRMDELTFDEYQLLLAIQRGLNLEALCDFLQGTKIDPVTLLPQVISRGWVVFPLPLPVDSAN
jgi:hypothetical protein